MNREQRRAAKYKRGQRWDRNQVMSKPEAAMTAIKLRKEYSADDFARLSRQARLAWYKLSNGMGTQDDYDMLGGNLNCVSVIVEQVDPMQHSLVLRAMQGMVRMRDRYERLGKFGADADLLQDMPVALDITDDVLSQATPETMLKALSISTELIVQGKVITPMTLEVTSPQQPKGTQHHGAF